MTLFTDQGLKMWLLMPSAEDPVGSEVTSVGCQTDGTPEPSCDRITSTDWSLSYIQAEQGRDAGLAEITRHLSAERRHVPECVRPLLRQWPRLRLVEGVLFRVYKRRPRNCERLQVVIPPHLVSGVLTSLHASSTGGHFNREKLLSQVQLRFWWPTVAADVNSCQLLPKMRRGSNSRNTPVPQPRAPMGELRASEPWETVSIDFLTNLPITARGNKHLLVCSDHFTRFCDVFALPDMAATTVATALVNGLFSRFGCPKYLHSDCAANFRSQVMAEVCRLMGITETNTSSAHPQGDGKCERTMRTIPFFLMFGREPRLPIDAELDVPARSNLNPLQCMLIVCALVFGKHISSPFACLTRVTLVTNDCMSAS